MPRTLEYLFRVLAATRRLIKWPRRARSVARSARVCPDTTARGLGRACFVIVVGSGGLRGSDMTARNRT